MNTNLMGLTADGADNTDEIWSASRRRGIRAFKSGDPALAGPQSKAVLAAAEAL
jgi:hypothetical protein